MPLACAVLENILFVSADFTAGATLEVDRGINTGGVGFQSLRFQYIPIEGMTQRIALGRAADGTGLGINAGSLFPTVIGGGYGGIGIGISAVGTGVGGISTLGTGGRCYFGSIGAVDRYPCDGTAAIFRGAFPTAGMLCRCCKTGKRIVHIRLGTKELKLCDRGVSECILSDGGYRNWNGNCC